MVKGRTRTVTEMEDAPAAAIVAPKKCKKSRQSHYAASFQCVRKMSHKRGVWCCGLECSMTMFLSELLLWDARPLVNRQGSKCGNHDPGAKSLLLSPQFPTWLRHHPPHLLSPTNRRIRPRATLQVNRVDCMIPGCYYHHPHCSSSLVCSYFLS
jgi:hypothetical protein